MSPSNVTKGSIDIAAKPYGGLSGLVPFVSVVIPCRNEERFIGLCLESVLAGDYPPDRYEVLVVDGMSSDNTRNIVAKYIRSAPRVVLIDNPRKVTPAALNIGITHAQGEIILRMDAHATYDKSYISRCVEALERYNADNVGGLVISRPRKVGRIGDAIVATFNHPFGAGAARYRTGTSKPVKVDTVFGGCYPRRVFDKVGLFNENLMRGQDIEFNLRLKQAGGCTILIPNAVAYYYMRSDLWSFVKHNWTNGIWAILPFAYSNVIPVSWRHLAPLGLVSSLIITATLGILSPASRWLFSGISGVYVMAVLLASTGIAWRTRDPWKLLLIPAAFACLHLPYGFGSLFGLFQTIWLLATGRARRGGPSPVAETSH